MGVSKVIYGGRTLIDISDSTTVPANTLKGVIGYDAAGNRFIGAYDVDNPTFSGRKLRVIFPSTLWEKTGDVFSQSVAAEVNGEYSIAQVLLAADELTALQQIEADGTLQKVELRAGSVYAEISELPDVPLTIELSIINGLAASSPAAVLSLSSANYAFKLMADSWVQEQGLYVQTAAVPGLLDGIVYGDALFDNCEFAEAIKVGKFEVLAGGIKATCYGAPPDIDISYFVKLFEEESL